MLLVVALIAAISVLAAGGDERRLRTACSCAADAKEIAAQLRYTRAQAIATGQPQRFTIDPAAHTWTAPNDRDGDDPANAAASPSPVRAKCSRDAAKARSCSSPTAPRTGGRVQLSAQQSAAWNIDVAWLTGEVKLRRGDGAAP